MNSIKIEYDDYFPSVSGLEIQKHLVQTESIDDSDYFLPDNVRQCQNSKNSWDQLVVSALEIASTIDPFREDVPEGTIVPVPAVDAAAWAAGRNCDIRPRLHDHSTGTDNL